MQLDGEDRRRLHLLEWILEEGTNHEDVSPFYADLGLPRDLAREDLRALQALHLADPYFEGGKAGRGSLTSDGRAYVESMRRGRKKMLERTTAAQEISLRWLANEGAFSDSQPKPWTGLATDELNDFYGERLSVDELDQAAASLLSSGLIDGIPTGETAGPVEAWLTHDGLVCVERHGGDIARFLSAERTRSVIGPIIHNYGDNAQIAIGDYSHQEMTINVVSENRDLVAGFAEILKAFGVDDGGELVRLFEAIVESDHAERRGRADRFGDRVRELGSEVTGDARAAIVALCMTGLVDHIHAVASFLS